MLPFERNDMCTRNIPSLHVDGLMLGSYTGNNIKRHFFAYVYCKFHWIVVKI